MTVRSLLKPFCIPACQKNQNGNAFEASYCGRRLQDGCPEKVKGNEL